MRSMAHAPTLRGFVSVLGLAAVAGFSSTASAQGWIVGVGAGAASQQRYEVAGTVDSYEDSDTAYRLFGAFMVSPNMGVVGSYVDLGKTRYEGMQSSFYSDDFEVSGIDMSYLIRWAPGSQERLSLFGTAGLFIWDQYVTHTDSQGVRKDSDDGSSFSLGVGADINLGAGGTGRWGIHIEYQLYKNVGESNNSGHEYDRDILTAGINYRFARFDRYRR
jgi:OmpA-like transmembrane domain